MLLVLFEDVCPEGEEIGLVVEGEVVLMQTHFTGELGIL